MYLAACSATAITSATVPSSTEQHHQNTPQLLRNQRPALMPAVGTQTQSLMARLALTSRYQVRPNSTRDMQSMNDYASMHVLVTDHQKQTLRRKELRAMPRKSVDPATLQLVIFCLEILQSLHSCCKDSQETWMLGSDLCSMLQASISGLDSDTASHKESRSLHVNDTTVHSRNASLQSHTDAEILQTLETALTAYSTRSRLKDASCLVRSLVAPTHDAECHDHWCKTQLASTMQKASKEPERWRKDPELIMKVIEGIMKLLSSSSCLPPIFLGSRPGVLYCCTREYLDAHSVLELLYLQLTLKCSTFFVHCTGSKHIAGGWNEYLACPDLFVSL